MCSVELVEDFHVVCVGSFIVKNGMHPHGFPLRVVGVDHRQKDGSHEVFVPGSGKFEFVYNSSQYSFSRTCHGEPVTSRLSHSNTWVHEKVIIEGCSQELVFKLIKESREYLETDVKTKLSTYNWDAANEMWKRDSLAPTRTFDSVILTPECKKILLDDLDDFVDTDTMSWYAKHGIPFRRGYLLHGPPGTGKTSTIMAIASKLNRKIYRINLVAPRLCDASLFTAMNEATKESIIVMEDVDSLFGKFRDKKEEFAVTFSGLLNAIDGIADTTRGMIFIFTSNHPDRLDPALRRKGRIDVEILLSHCSRQQCIDMFLRFYPGFETLASDFASNVQHLTRHATPAQLQHHFIACRLKMAKDAVQVAPDLFVSNDDEVNMWT